MHLQIFVFLSECSFYDFQVKWVCRVSDSNGSFCPLDFDTEKSLDVFTHFNFLADRCLSNIKYF